MLNKVIKVWLFALALSLVWFGPNREAAGAQDYQYQQQQASPVALLGQAGNQAANAASQAGNQAANMASQAGGQAIAALSAFGGQARDQAGQAWFQLQGFRDQLATSVERQIPKRVRRQVTYAQDGARDPQQGGVDGSSGGGGIMKYLNELNQRSQQAQAISQFMQGVGASGSQGSNSPTSQSSAAATVAQMVTQLSDLIKSTQNRGARLLESNQRSLEATSQQTMDAARNTQSGVQAAISDLTQGLQRLAANNPNLLPDLKSLYQTVSSKLASNSAANSAAGANQVPPSLAQ